MSTPPPPPRAFPDMGMTGTAAVVAGTPLAILSVMLWENHFGVQLTSIQAVGVGGVGSTFLGYLWHLFTTYMDRAIAPRSPPP